MVYRSVYCCTIKPSPGRCGGAAPSPRGCDPRAPARPRHMHSVEYLRSSPSVTPWDCRELLEAVQVATAAVHDELALLHLQERRKQSHARVREEVLSVFKGVRDSSVMNMNITMNLPHSPAQLISDKNHTPCSHLVGSPILLQRPGARAPRPGGRCRCGGRPG